LNLTAAFIERIRKVPRLVLIGTVTDDSSLPSYPRSPNRFSDKIRLEIPNQNARYQILRGDWRKIRKASPSSLSDMRMMTEGQTPTEVISALPGRVKLRNLLLFRLH
jgi:SpoVK/Ycf46/Vps4 family AAA+-type ATPase